MNIEKILKKMKTSNIALQNKGVEEINLFLKRLSDNIYKDRKNILGGNRWDLISANKMGQSSAFLERLKIDETGIKNIILRLQNIAKLKSYQGEVLEQRQLKNGLHLKKVAVPLGTILVIYEARPEVTVDVAALCIKSGNSVILKGGREALRTNMALFKIIKRTLSVSGIPGETVYFIDNSDRNFLRSFLKMDKFIDLVIARGGYEMVSEINEISKIPVLSHSSGGARIYVDESADLDITEKIIINAKISKPSACNSLDTLIVHQKIAANFLPKISVKLRNLGVSLMGDHDEETWKKEFLGLTLSIKIVSSIQEAIDFIRLYTKGHSEGIIAQDPKAIDKFTKSIDSAAIFINCSTRFHDGYEFGMGAEMGIATGKLHARGPVGLRELTSYKWIVTGDGQIRR